MYDLRIYNKILNLYEIADIGGFEVYTHRNYYFYSLNNS